MGKIDLSAKAKPTFSGADLSALLGGGTPAGDIVQLPLTTLVPYPDQPFKPYSADKLERLVEDVRTNGVLSPIIVRPMGSQYQILAGHNRWNASKRAGKDTIPAIVKDVDDDTAALIMVNTNLNQRDELLPSEKAFAYRVQLEAMKRRAGRPTGDNLSHNGTQKRSDQQMAEQVGESRNTIQRYIRLTYLVPGFLQQVDTGDLSLLPAEALSFLSVDEQQLVLEVSAACDRKISVFQSTQLKKRMGKLTTDMVADILLPAKDWNPQQCFVSQSRALIPKSANPDDVSAVLQLIKAYFEKEM